MDRTRTPQCLARRASHRVVVVELEVRRLEQLDRPRLSELNRGALVVKHLVLGLVLALIDEVLVALTHQRAIPLVLRLGEGFGLTATYAESLCFLSQS